MLIIKIKAGLGNQLFQYAFGRSLAKKRNEKLYLDISSFNNQPEREAKRDFLLSYFAIDATVLSDNESAKYNSPLQLLLRKFSAKINPKNAYTYYPNELASKKTYHEGYWLNEKYFKDIRDELCKTITLKEPLGSAAENILSQINVCIKNNETPISLNIRRGDFVTNPHSAFNGLVSLEHYERAIDLLKNKYNEKNLHVFVFSDDIAWAQEHLKLPCVLHFVSNPNIKDYEELILISKCSHNIIANSTFSWWGAWLNQNNNKVVIAPKQWLKDKTAHELDITPPEWVTL